MADISIKLAHEQAYPSDPDSIAGAIERGWRPLWYVGRRERTERTEAFGLTNEQILPHWVYETEDEDEALELALWLFNSQEPGCLEIIVSEVDPYTREQCAAERAFESRF